MERLMVDLANLAFPLSSECSAESETSRYL